MSRSTLADANALRPCAVFSDLFAAMVRRAVDEATYLIDSTGVGVSGPGPSAGAEWARFSRWVKQTLKIRHFLGTSENAVRIQIAVALIAFLLLRTAQAAQKLVRSPLAFARLVRANLMHKRRLDRLIGPSPTPPIDPNQTVPQWP